MAKVTIFPTKETVEVAPGEKYVDLPITLAPKVGIVRWVPVGDGSYKPRLQVMETWIRVTAAAQFGVHIKRDTLIRLGVAGFISISQPSPQNTSVSLESLLEHLERCKDPEFWTEARLVKYRRALPIFSTV